MAPGQATNFSSTHLGRVLVDCMLDGVDGSLAARHRAARYRAQHVQGGAAGLSELLLGDVHVGLGMLGAVLGLGLGVLNLLGHLGGQGKQELGIGVGVGVGEVGVVGGVVGGS